MRHGDDDITELPQPDHPRGKAPDRPRLALLVAWSLEEPDRVGELALVPHRGASVLGRGGDGDAGRLDLLRQRPGASTATGGLRAPAISRQQLRVSSMGDRLQIENLGRLGLLRDGSPVAQAIVRPGDALEVQSQLVLLCVERPATLPTVRYVPPDEWPRFGEADRHGIVGESVAAWELRDRIAFLAPRKGHVLILGPSGAGKELAARAIHRMSPRGARTLVARNAATFPAGLIDAELFGNVRDFPNPGMRDRPGLVGEADGSTLFLDEIGELPAELQAHLLRVLDADGEYQRLGEPRRRTADLRLVAATNRPADSLKSDLAARLRHVLVVPSLAQRRDDIPLLARALLQRAAEDDPHVAERFFELRGGCATPRLAPELVAGLLAHPLELNLRELDALLWRSMTESRGDRLEPPSMAPSTRAEPDAEPDEGGGWTDPTDVTPEQIQECLDRHEGIQGPVWRELGFRNRYVLQRLIRKHGLRVASVSPE